MRIRSFLAAVGCLTLAAATSATHAGKVPSSRETREVIDYYFSDAEQPVLMDFRLCRAIHDDGPGRYDCQEPLSERDLAPGMRIYAWMKFLVPQTATPTIMLQIDHNARTRDTWKRQLDGAVRFRTWHAVELDGSGRWRLEVYHADGGDPVRLYSRTVRID